MKQPPKKHATAKQPKHSKAKPATPNHKKHPAAKPHKGHKAHKPHAAHQPHKGHQLHKPHRAKAALGLASREAYIPDLRDDRDHVYTAPSCRPEFVDLSATLPPVWDQGDEGSCVAHAALAVHLYALAKAGRQATTTTGRVYWDARVLEGAAGDDVGTQVRSAVKACAAGTDVEYLTLGFGALQACLSEGYPVVLGLTVFDGFEDGDSILPTPSPTHHPLDAHCMTVVGIGYGREWTDYPDADPGTEYVKVRNSWGTGVYLGGHLLMPTTYIQRHGADLWTIRTP